MDFGKLPHKPNGIEVTPFKAHAEDAQLEDLKRRICETPTPKKTYENSTTKEQLGITRDWLVKAIDRWEGF